MLIVTNIIVALHNIPVPLSNQIISIKALTYATIGETTVRGNWVLPWDNGSHINANII